MVTNEFIMFEVSFNESLQRNRASLKIYKSPIVSHRQIETEQGFLVGSTETTTGETPVETWTDQEISGEFDWDD